MDLSSFIIVRLDGTPTMGSWEEIDEADDAYGDPDPRRALVMAQQRAAAIAPGLTIPAPEWHRRRNSQQRATHASLPARERPAIRVGRGSRF